MRLRQPRLARPCKRWSALALLPALWVGGAVAATADLPITAEQRSTAQQVAQAGVPLSELAPNAPDSHTVKRGDTLWDIASIFLKSPWRWPELWGMNLEQIRNPHLIYPGQVLLLTKVDGRAQLRLATAVGPASASETVKLSPRVRSSPNDLGAISAIALRLIGPFLNEAMVFNSDELAGAPRIVATQENHVLLSEGETAYVMGDLKGAREFAMYREAKPLLDPTTREVLGFEASYVGTSEFTRAGGMQATADGKGEIAVPASFKVTSVRKEAGVGDRLSPVLARDYAAFVPHAPAGAMDGQIVSVYGEGLWAGQNQVVALNRGSTNGLERGHVLALWRDGAVTVDPTDPKRPAIKLPNERVGLLFVFRVFDRVSYALILSASEPVQAGDRFTRP
jgi:hypothetical protein